MNKQFSQPPLSRPAPPSKAPAETTPAKRAAMRFVEAATPPPSPTRLPVAAPPKPAPIGPKELQAEIIADYKAKHGPRAVPDLDHVMAEVWKRLGLSCPPAKQKRQFRAD